MMVGIKCIPVHPSTIQALKQADRIDYLCHSKHAPVPVLNGSHLIVDVAVPEGISDGRIVVYTNAMIAAVCHEANRAICLLSGDTSQKPWSEAEQWQRDSAIRGVEFALKHPNASAAAQHDAWTNDKIADGWIRGNVKCAHAKTHPCLVPYEDLPLDQRSKDAVFKMIVKALANLH